MSRRKDKANETEIAKAGEGQVEPVVPAEHAEPPADALVESDGGAAAKAASDEHAGEPAPAAPGSDGGGEDAGEPEGEPAPAAPEDLAPEAIQPAGGRADGDLGDDGSVNDSDGSADGRVESYPSDRPLPFPSFDGGTTAMFRGALAAAHAAEYYGHRFDWHTRAYAGEEAAFPTHALLSEDIAQALYVFVAKLRERATADVLAQELVIRRYRRSAELSRPERLALATFAAVAREFLTWEDEVMRELESARAGEEKPRTVLVEDTTLELSDGPGDRGR